MAEAFLRKYGGDQFDAYSAGTDPKSINPYTGRVMKEIGGNLSGQYSKHIMEYMGKVHFGYLITLCNEAEKSCPTTFPGIAQRLQWSFEDPAALEGSDDEKLMRFREVRDKIGERIKSWLSKIQSE